MQTMVILHLFPLVICLKLTIGESVCMASLCEDTLYNIKLHTHVDLDISTKGSKNQCPKSKNYILKFVLPYDVQWFDVGIPITIYNTDCRSFTVRNAVENILDDTDYACSNTRFFLFRQLLGSNECGYVFYVYEGTLPGITKGDGSGNFRFMLLKNSSLMDDVDSIGNSTTTWCFHTISKMDVGAGNMPNPLIPYCEYYMYQNGYSSNGTSHVLSTNMVVENQTSAMMPLQMVEKSKIRQQKCRAKRIMERQ